MEVKLESLTVSERKAFRQRVKYWLGRGLTQKEAETKAAEKLSDAGKVVRKEAETKAAEKLSDAGKVVRFPSRVAEKPDVERRNPCGATDLTSDAEDEDESRTSDAEDEDESRTSDAEDEDESRTSDAEDGSRTSDAEDESRTSDARDGSRTSDAEKETIPVKPRRKPSLDDFWSSLPFSVIAELAACLIVMTGATTFLVVATVTVLGDTWLGWVQALTLELGAVVVAMVRFQLNFHGFLTKGIMVGLVALSGNILHTGVEENRSSEITTALTNDEVLKNLRSRRQMIEDIYNNRPKNQVSNRTKDLKLLSAIDEEIKKELAKLKDSKTVIDKKSDMDLFMRLGLMVLNLVLAHHFIIVLRRHRGKMFHVEHF